MMLRLKGIDGQSVLVNSSQIVAIIAHMENTQIYTNAPFHIQGANATTGLMISVQETPEKIYEMMKLEGKLLLMHKTENAHKRDAEQEL